MKSPYANNGHAAYLPTATQAIARRAKQPELRTFQAWSDDGYKIVKGSKHVSRNADGVCLFSADQVEKYTPSRGYGYGCGPHDWGSSERDDWDDSRNPANFGDS